MFREIALMYLHHSCIFYKWHSILCKPLVNLAKQWFLWIILFLGGHSTFFALLNTFVHIVMYFYYMVAAMGPEYQKYIWWKKYLTSFQMIQFVAIFVHQFQLLFTECNYPKSFMVWIALHGLLFLFLFSDFYKTKYTDKKAVKNGGACMVSRLRIQYIGFMMYRQPSKQNCF